MREEFDAWVDAMSYEELLSLDEDSLWLAWQASRAALKVELPKEKSLNFYNENTVMCNDSYNDCLFEVKQMLNEAGISYE